MTPSVTCAAEVWTAQETHRCHRMPVVEIEAVGHYRYKLGVCGQHGNVARRQRSMWLFVDDGPKAAVWFSEVHAL